MMKSNPPVVLWHALNLFLLASGAVALVALLASIGFSWPLDLVLASGSLG